MDTHHLETVREKILKCMGCGVCRGIWDRRDEAMCPVWATGIGFEDSVPRGRVTVAQDLLDGFLSYSPTLAESVYRCTDCFSCTTVCDAMDPDTGEPIVDVPGIVKAMRMDLVENSLVPPVVRDYFKAIHVNENPYKEPQQERGRWAEAARVEIYSGQEFLFYAGDVGSFDERGKRMAESVARLLVKGGVSLGILGTREFSDGNDVKALGEKGLFQYLAERNIRIFKEAGVKKVICLDPHSFNTFRKDYPALGGDFEVWHYSQILARLLEEGNIPLHECKAKATYHDPCYLGRHNGEYESPRDILEAIPGLELVEMRRSRKNSFCCGGGGGNFFTDLLGGGINSPNRIRVREALETGAQVLAVSCPLCAKMLEDAVKAENAKDQIRVKDLSEIVLEASRGSAG